MFYSTVASQDAKSCKIKNGTIIYYKNARLDCNCLAPIKTDSDFGGAAVIASFVALGWITIFVAAVPTIWSMAKTWNRVKGRRRFWRWLWEIIQFEPNHYERKMETLGYPPRFSKIPPEANRTTSFFEESNGSINTDEGSDSKQPLPEYLPYHLHDPEPIYIVFARRILFQLCDIQIITGIAMLVAALAQHSDLTFYHAQLAQQYWWITLNSFWISRIDYSRNSPSMTTWRAHARRSAIWLSVALSVVIQTIVTMREHFDWDPTIPGKCYKADETGTSYAQNMFWLCGTGVYFLVVTMSLFTVSRKWWDKGVNDRIEPSIDRMNKLFSNGLQDFKSYRQATRESSFNLVHSVARYAMLVVLGVKFIIYAVAWIFWWIFILFMSIWCAGNSSAPLELLIYGGIAAFLTWWILFLKIRNKPLMEGREEEWTFGATLSLFIFIFIVFHTLDVWAGVKRDAYVTRRQKKDEEAQQEMPESGSSAINDFATEVREITDGSVMPRVSVEKKEESPGVNLVPNEKF